MGDGDVEAIRVLHVDDNPDWGDLVTEFLEREHEALSVITEPTASGALDRLDTESVDCIVSDYDMPGMDGLELLEAVRERDRDLPFILFTGKGSEEIASEAVSVGVTEYLQKGTATEQYTLLANRIERAVTERRARDALRESERMLSTLISNLPGMVYRCRDGPGWSMEFVSQGCEELTGYRPVELESGEVTWNDLLVAEDSAETLETIELALEAGEPFELTYQIETKDGEIRWVWERGSGVYEGGELIAREGFVTDITPRKRREQELRAEREFTESALNALEDVFFVFDPETEQFVRWNDRLTERTGYDDSEIASMRPIDIVADEHTDRVGAAVADAIETGEVTVTADVVLKDGDRVPFEFRGRPLYEEGELTGIGAVGRDISERRERTRELEKHRTLVENVGDPMYVLDTEGRIQMINSAMAEYLGYDRSEIEGADVSKFLPAADVARGQEVIADLLDGDTDGWHTWEMETIHADGQRRTNEDKTAVIVDDGEFVGSVGVLRDISERKARERELERFETVVQAVGDPVYALDADGRFRFVNDAFEPMTGYEPAELVGEHIGTILGDDDVQKGQRYIDELREDDDRRAVKYEITVETKDGEQVPSELHLALLPTDDGAFRGTAGIIRDIETRKQREKRLEQFASVVSHDLRSPLNVIMGRIELARETGELDHLEAIAESADRMEELIEDLLTLARQGETVGERTEVDVTTIADRAWGSVETRDATLETDETAVGLAADPERLQELLENLIRNSIQHGGREVTVAVGELTTERGFYVADDGAGIPPETRDDVFGHGYTTDEDGTGFGLAIVERIAHAHGWTVSVTDSESGGARFEFVVT